MDLGTTTVAAFLWDLEAGRRVAVKTATNAQSRYGPDVMSRLRSALRVKGGRGKLQQTLAVQVDQMVEEMLTETGLAAGAVERMILVGNSCIHHLFLGLDPSTLAVAPFQPVTRDTVRLRAGEAGLAGIPRAELVFLPLIGGFVGADTVAAMVATGVGSDERTALLLDLGTNGEVVLAASRRVLACSTAAGPAFEGAGISAGMRAAPGAIVRVEAVDQQAHYPEATDSSPLHWVRSGGLSLGVAGDGPPQGLCGSGLVDLVACLLDLGVIDVTGRIRGRQEVMCPQRILSTAAGNAYLVLPKATTVTGKDLLLTQEDVRALQTAGAAVAAGVRVLAGLQDEIRDPAAVGEIHLAGAFGNHLGTRSMGRTGFVPVGPEARVVAAGNAAGRGAELVLLDPDRIAVAEDLAGRVEHVELAGLDTFEAAFLESLVFPESSWQIPRQS